MSFVKKKVGNKHEYVYSPPKEIMFAPPAPIVDHTYYTPPDNYSGYGSMASNPNFARYLNSNTSNTHKFKKSVRKTRKSSKKSRKNRSSHKSTLKKKCQKWVSNKIAINMREYKEGKYKSPKQAIAVAYSQVLKKHPECKRVLRRKSVTKNKK